MRYLKGGKYNIYINLYNKKISRRGRGNFSEGKAKPPPPQKKIFVYIILYRLIDGCSIMYIYINDSYKTSISTHK